MNLVVDLRRAFDSGLGTYIRHVVPETLAQLPQVRLAGLVGARDAGRHRRYLNGLDITLHELNAAPLSLSEQWVLRRCAAPGAVFWATTLSHALFKSQRLVATVHDVAQLALSASDGFSVGVQTASRVYFSSLRRQAALLLFNSQFTSNEFDRLVGAGGTRRRVTPLGVDAAHWAVRPDPHTAPIDPETSNRRFFLWVGNLRPHKNLRLLLSAFEKVANVVDLDLVVVGRAPEGTLADTFKQTLPPAVAARVHMLGELDGPEVRQLMQTAQALVMPSLYEGFGLPVLEGFAAGCLVLSSTAGALRETGGDCALYFDPRDVDALARCLVHAVHMPPNERQMHVERGLVRARSMSWQHTAALTAKALQDAFFTPGQRAAAKTPKHTPASLNGKEQESANDAH